MKKILLATIGLAMFATPLAAGTPHSSGVSQHERHLNSLNPHASAVQAPTRLTSRFSGSPAGGQSFGLTAPRNGAGPQFSRGGPWPHQDLRDRYGRIDR
jgi:hypothetical protein